jgi:ABC-type lipoprotein release transport system permease subunit
MPDYRNFADSVFSREIWNNEGHFWLLLAFSVLAVTSVVFLFARSYHNEKLLLATLWVGSGVVAVGVIVMIFGPYVVNDFNRNVVETNIAAKYDTSKLKFNYYDPATKTVRAYYADKDSSTNKELTFTFEKDGIEPFLVKYISDDSLNNIEKAISKAE